MDFWLQSLLANRLAQVANQVANQVAFWSDINRVPQSKVGIPVGIAIMIFGGQYDIVGASFDKPFRPGIGIPLFGFEFSKDVFVAKL